MNNIKAYRNHLPSEWLSNDSFLHRNPNISYLVSDGFQDDHCILIDASGDFEEMFRDIKQRRLRLDYILLTHAHMDHRVALSKWVKLFPDIKIGVHKSSFKSLPSYVVNKSFPLEDGKVVPVGNELLSVVHTPGHSIDSVCFWDKKGNNLFSGDVIFGGNIGCCDYSARGNRNIFYQTILRLLSLLPGHTKIYPGHFSEAYQAPPPYSLQSEKINNPYLANVLQGKRGDFDRDLKVFSSEFEFKDYVMLREPDIEKICELERETWIPELQSSRETALKRLYNGHNFLAVRDGGEFVGMIVWCYSKHSIMDPKENFPRKFAEFSTCRSCSKKRAKSAFIYSLGVIKSKKGQGFGSMLLQRAFERMSEDGINQVFVDSRMPSYNGSTRYYHENILRNPEFKKAIGRYFAMNVWPRDHEFFLDPTVRFYIKNGFRPYLIIKDFIQDEPSGNIRIIGYMDLEIDDQGAFNMY